MPWLSCIISNVVLASLLALTAWFVQRRLQQPAVARLLWLLVLIKLVTPPLWSVPLRESSGPMACALGLCACGQHAQTQSLIPETWPWILLAAWSIGAGATAWTAWRRWSHFRRLLTHALPAPLEWQSLAAQLSAELRLRRPPEVLTVPGRLPPLVMAGWHGPRMLLPTSLLDRLDHSQREALLLHELAHIRRGDHLVRMLELLVSVVYWWLPIVGSIGRKLRDCEEACCDAAVVARRPQARREYARLLLDVVDFTSSYAGRSLPQATAMSAAQNLECRLRTILSAGPGPRRTWPVGAITVGLACAILPCQLQYNFARQPSPAPPATPTERQPVGPTQSPEADLNFDPSATFCCPSSSLTKG